MISDGYIQNSTDAEQNEKDSSIKVLSKEEAESALQKVLDFDMEEEHQGKIIFFKYYKILFTCFGK